MENKVTKFGLRKMLAVLAVAFACVCMWGCSDDVTFRWSDGRGSAEIAGFIDDSLVVVTDCREWYEDTETWNGGYYSDVSCGHDRMMVYNYRVQENGPRWSDSLTNKSNGYHWYQMTDSVFWRWEGDDILLWKVGEKAHEMKLSRKNDGCSESFKIDRIRQWLDGKFIALGGKFDADGENCQYAVLDTVEKTLAFKRLDEKLEWIKECDDVRAWDKDVYCLALNRESYDAFLIINEFIRDTMMRDEFKLGNYAIVSFWGNYISLHRTLGKYENNSVKRLTSYSSQGISFGDGKGNYITYEN